MPELQSIFSIRSLLADTDVFNKFSIKVILADRKAFGDGTKTMALNLKTTKSTTTTTTQCRQNQAVDATQGVTYSTAISMALRSSPEQRLPLQAIYRWIERNYPHFASNNENWRDTVRYNLSHNKIFVRVPRPVNDPGRGKYWTIDDNAEEAKYRSRSAQLRSKRQVCHPYPRSKRFCGDSVPPNANSYGAIAAEQSANYSLMHLQQEYTAWNIYTHYRYHQYEI